jgi:UV DNA damage endonuclease
LKDPSQPKHATKNCPDNNKPADISLGQKWVESLGLANARDIIKMVRWNDKYGIKFMRLSSEMFPFASHKEYGYKLVPFAAETLAEVGKVIAELGHRVTTHPGQFTQLGSPRKQVIDNAIRDLEYHDEMLSLLNLPPQQDRDAVIILHMGGMFGSKEETLVRFRENYANLSPSIKNRLVLENDDMAWSVHDLLPICQELNIPLVLDFHHHNIIFDASKLREGTKDIMELFPVIRETWTRKRITQKMHYSEPTSYAITWMQRRKHSPRVTTLPPCQNDMDLMIEAKDKEQAVFELMKAFKLPGFERFNDIVPHVRSDENKPKSKRKKKASPKRKRANKVDEVSEETTELEEEGNEGSNLIPEEEIGMGGPDNRVYWPPGMEEWLRPKKRQVKTNDADEERKPKTPRKRKSVENQADGEATQPTQTDELLSSVEKANKIPRKRTRKDVRTSSTSDAEVLVDEDDQDASMMPVKALRKSKRSSRVNYVEAEQSELD